MYTCLLIREHKELLQNGSEVDVTARQRKEFPNWFKDHVSYLFRHM